MSDLLQMIKSNDVYVISVMALLLLIELIWILALNARFSSFLKGYRRVINGRTGEDLEDILSSYLGKVEGNVEKITEFEERMKQIEKRTELALQKVGIVRYNAFSEMGSDQSFSIALLDLNDNGFVITGIFGRDDTVTYAKPIENGTSRYPLSAEEIQAIDRARKRGI
ncbi:DUF4446 family protein [Calorimonas adulescens]|uniref:DUF4446 family protein n=1 Tax=Calorimonas adulescens TaxID=2606906 RepID=A0A5D8Q7Y8_9THEO|nr:DUF4446 family protein [Calorimonas adulescens]TZE80750.1 DUF4446 family protein [Calorimonas adulescens]